MSNDGWARQALAGARPAVFWSDRDDAPQPAPALRSEVTADLTVIGGGLTGLWAALQALEDQPAVSVVLLEGERVGFGASSRNGGFCDGSITHGLRNGLFHWPDEISTLVRLGRENLDGIDASVDRYQIDADYRRAAEIDVATEEWHLKALEEALEEHASVGDAVELLGTDAMQARIHSPTYLGGLVRSNDISLVDPARLCWGLRAAAELLGAMVYENSPAVAVESDGSALKVVTPNGSVRTGRVVVATNAYDGPIRRPRRYIIPVYDHVLITDPLSTNQMASIGWQEREGVGDASNQFHYYRLTEDNRILWGGYDATYHFGNGVDP